MDRFGFSAGYNSVKRFASSLIGGEPAQFDRFEFGPAEEMQVDYGEGAATLYPGTDRYRKPRLFVGTLRYSRRSFRRVVWKSSQETRARLHEQAWRYFGGSCSYVVLDNLKEGVIKPDLYEPELNPVYAAVLAHYGVVADPARVRDPNRKGTMENAIGHTQSSALKGRRFASIEEQNDFLEHWKPEHCRLRRGNGRTSAMAEPETVSLEARQAGLGSESRNSTSKCRQTVQSTKLPVRFLRSRHSRRKLPNFVWQPAGGRCTPNSGHWLQLPQWRLCGGSRPINRIPTASSMAVDGRLPTAMQSLQLLHQ